MQIGDWIDSESVPVEEELPEDLGLKYLYFLITCWWVETDDVRPENNIKLWRVKRKPIIANLYFGQLKVLSSSSFLENHLYLMNARIPKEVEVHIGCVTVSTYG